MYAFLYSPLLHWLPVEHRISLKITNMTFNTLCHPQPAYLHFLLCFHTPAHSLRSSNTNLLTFLFVCTVLGAHSFSVASPKLWNSLPPALRCCKCPDTFCQQLRTHYFQQAFSSLHAAQIWHDADIAQVYKFLLTVTLGAAQMHTV